MTSQRTSYELQLQLRDQKHLSFPHNLLEEAEKDVVVDCPLVRLVKHDDAVRRQQRIKHHLSQQHAVGTELHFGLRTDSAATSCKTAARQYVMGRGQNSILAPR